MTADNAADFWAARKQWFFKPAAGYGSKAAYRGDKLTKRVFEEISRGGYVAQALVTPSERRLLVDRDRVDVGGGRAEGQVRPMALAAATALSPRCRTPLATCSAARPERLWARYWTR